MIEARALSKTFHVHEKEPGLRGSLKALVRRKRVARHAVREATFTVGEGEIVGLVGANGAGKTTLVKMLAGIVHPTSGDASVLGFRPWERDNRLRRQIALVMGQKAQLWWDLPAGDCFLLLREIYQTPKAQFDQALDELASLLEVKGLLTTQIRRLSLGERMKMELMATLLHRPRVVFLDEPTIGLDLNAQQAIREFILGYQKRHAPAMIVTSHYMEDIERLCPRIVIIREGQLVYDGSLDQVVRAYAPCKAIVAHLDDSTEQPACPELENLGTLVERTRTLVKLRVPRAEVPAAAAFLVNRFAVSDLAIEEEDIGAVIANIIGRRSPEQPGP